MADELDQTFIYYPAELAGFDDYTLKAELYRREKLRIKNTCPYCLKPKLASPCVHTKEHISPISGKIPDSYKCLEDLESS